MWKLINVSISSWSNHVPSVIFGMFFLYSKLSSSGSLFFRSGFQIIAHSKLGYDLTIRKYNPSSK